MEGLKKKWKKIEKKYGIFIYMFLSIILLQAFSVTNIMTYLLVILAIIFIHYLKLDFYLSYILGGAIAALLFKTALGLVLATDYPVVSVLTSSMLHDKSTEINHYKWLEENLGYNRSYIESWPIKDGFDVGDLPIVQGSDNYRVGDVVVYEVPGQKIPVIHRIIKINPDGSYMIKGDHNSGLLPFEYSVKKEQIKGKVIFIIPKLGYFKVILHWFLGGI
ncbi:MAG: signal peptidase I [Candidatus Aenigmatarchaeota archaeon]